jgi:hypothetical protein
VGEKPDPRFVDSAWKTFLQYLCVKFFDVAKLVDAAGISGVDPNI